MSGERTDWAKKFPYPVRTSGPMAEAAQTERLAKRRELQPVVGKLGVTTIPAKMRMVAERRHPACQMCGKLTLNDGACPGVTSTATETWPLPVCWTDPACLACDVTDACAENGDRSFGRPSDGCTAAAGRGRRVVV